MDAAARRDYDLGSDLSSGQTGLRQGLTSYGDAHFSLFLRKVFIKAQGLSDDALSRPIVGIINTYSSFNPCHGKACLAAMNGHATKYQYLAMADMGIKAMCHSSSRLSSAACILLEGLQWSFRPFQFMKALPVQQACT
jgi:hypothetical protein